MIAWRRRSSQALDSLAVVTTALTSGPSLFTYTGSGGYNLEGEGSHAFAVFMPATIVSINADFGENDIISGKWAAGDQLIINRIIFSVQWDRVTSQFLRHYVYSFDSAIAKYGVRPSLVVKSKGIGGCGGSANLGALDQRALNIGIRFADPPAQLELTVFYRRHVLEPGDRVRVTCPWIPNLISGARGLVDEEFEVVAINYGYAAGGIVTMSLLDVEAITVPGNPSVIFPPEPPPPEEPPP
jgi:hypothetical protein